MSKWLLGQCPLYPRKRTSLFARIAANDTELSRLHLARPAGVALHLASAELVARNLESFSIGSPSIAKELQLPDFEHSNRTAWPPPKLSLAATYAMTMAPQRDSHFTADWAAARAEDKKARRAKT